MPPQRDISNLFFLYAIVFYHQRQTNIDFLRVSFIISSCRHYIETNTLLHFITVIIKNTSSPKKKKKKPVLHEKKCSVELQVLPAGTRVTITSPPVLK